MFYNIITKFYNILKNSVNCPMYKISYIVPLALFFLFNNMVVFLINGVIYLYGFQSDLRSHSHK